MSADQDARLEASFLQNIEAERTLLGTALVHATAVAELRGLIEPRHFYRSAHRLIFEAMLALAGRGEPIDLVALSTELQAGGRYEEIGGALYVASLTEVAAASTENLKHHARIVRERAVRKAAHDAGLRLAESTRDITVDVSEAITKHRKTVRGIVEDHGAIQKQAWMEQVKTIGEVLDTDFPPIESIIGNGILTRASFGLFAGHSGLGKTYLTIQIMRTILSGEPFFGQDMRPVRVGMLEFEMPWQSMKARMLKHGGFDQYRSGADLLCMPKGRWYLNDRDVVERVVDWCGERSLGLLVLDPLNRTRRGDPYDEDLAAEWLDNVHEITERTGTTILTVAHVRKIPTGGNKGPRTNASVVDSIRLPSRFMDDADTILHFEESFEGGERLIRFEWAKTRFGAQPAPVFVKRKPNGFFEVVDGPQAKREEGENKLFQLLRGAGTDGVKTEAVMEQMECSKPTAIRMLRRLGAAQRGGSKAARWFLKDAIAEIDSRQEGLAVMGPDAGSSGVDVGSSDPSQECPF